MSPDQPTDDDLMQRYRRGDAAAFDRLYERHKGPLFRYLLNHCGDSGLAEELYQDTWLKAIRARDQWQAGQGVRPWLFQIARHRLVDHWRRRRADQALADEEQVVDLHRPWPDALLALKDCVERLYRLLTGLGEVQRDAFLLKEEAGLTLEQIARVTGVGRETVKSRLRYATQRLRAGLEGCDEPL